MADRNKAGLTLMELMFVVLIIGILASIATVKYANLYRKADEGGLQGNLGSIRSALSIYYADTDGQYPLALTVLTVGGKYLAAIPAAKIPNYHLASALTTVGSSVDDAGGWLYNGDSSHIRFGASVVNCVHTDTKGTVWSAY